MNLDIEINGVFVPQKIYHGRDSSRALDWLERICASFFTGALVYFLACVCSMVIWFLSSRLHSAGFELTVTFTLIAFLGFKPIPLEKLSKWGDVRSVFWPYECALGWSMVGLIILFVLGWQEGIEISVDALMIILINVLWNFAKGSKYEP